MISVQQKYVSKEREGCRLDQRAKQRAEVEEERKRSEEEVCDYVSK